MRLWRDLLALISESCDDVAEHLDDTLLNRLEGALYCENEHHGMWDDFYGSNFRKFMASFESNLQDTELFRGKLKIKFAILWRMRDYCQSSDFEVATRMLSSLIDSRKCSLISSLHTFYQKSLLGLKTFNLLGDNLDSHLSILLSLYQASPNVNHRRSIVLLYILLSLSGFENYKSAGMFRRYMESMDICSCGVDFLVDLLTELVKVPHLSNGICSMFLRKCAESVEILLSKSTSALGDKDELTYLSILLAPYEPNALEYAINHDNLSNVGGYLRRLLTNGVLQDCEPHRLLVRSWYSQIEDSFNGSKTTLAKALTPLSTCLENPLHHCVFRDVLPPTFTNNLWNFSISLLLQNQFDNISKNCWLLFNRCCHLQEDTRKREQLQFLLNHICNHSQALAEFSVLMDSVFTLYSTPPSITLTERLDVFQRIYCLAHEECINLKSSGRCLSYSFLLLRIYQSDFLNETIALQLLRLQKLVSKQIADEPSLTADETVTHMHCGFFITPLLESHAREIFTPQIFDQILDLVATLEVAKALNGEEQTFPSTLKGALLACLLRCLDCPIVLEHLLATDTLCLALEKCADLSSAEWEGDPLIRKRVFEFWNVLFKKVETEQNSPEMRSLLERFRPHFSLTAPIQIGHSVCPSCGECIHGLLEDIILSNQTVEDLDCVGD
ncbi:unnamed protein product [Hydatigera taeniaeformis]|uniref:Thyroid adenoma-associated protein homolog n=1 Tax=Hydatigena taeniaeformis TaxID=6205 RepID=A0A0R3WJK7_HYDTA|nr:unnamed protein product [Hydatigera taeniaeformis]